MPAPTEVLVIGAGVTGMKASLLLATAGRRVHLVEKTSVTGGNLIRCEDVFTGMECATCMISPMQQDVLRNEMIETITLARVTSVEDCEGGFRVRIRQEPSCVDPVACIGCGECWEACPVEAPNPFEENMVSRKAMSVPCAGALPNVPWIDRDVCRRWTGEDPECSLCAEACAFEAVDYSAESREIDLEVSHIIVATGFRMPEKDALAPLGWGDYPGVYTAMEFERLFASNGPTSGEIVLRDGRVPASAAVLVHAGEEDEASDGHLTSLCAIKYVHYLHHKVPDIRVTLLYDNLCTPGRQAQRFFEEALRMGAGLVECRSDPSVSVGRPSDPLEISCSPGESGGPLNTDMLILVTGILPSEGTGDVLDVLGIDTPSDAPPGVEFAGTAAGWADIAQCTVSASAAVGRVLGSGGNVP